MFESRQRGAETRLEGLARFVGNGARRRLHRFLLCEQGLQQRRSFCREREGRTAFAFGHGEKMFCARQRPARKVFTCRYLRAAFSAG